MNLLQFDKTYQINALQFDNLTYDKLSTYLLFLQYKYTSIQRILQNIYKSLISIVIQNTVETLQITNEIKCYLHTLNQCYQDSKFSKLYGYYVNKPKQTKDCPITYSQTMPSKPFSMYIYPISTSVIKGVKHYNYRYLYTTYSSLTNYKEKSHTGTFSISSVQKKITLLPFHLQLEWIMLF